MTSPISAELQARISMWRLKVADGTITPEELKEAIVLLRQGRLAAASAAQSSAAKKKRAISEIPSADSMLDELSGM